MNNHDACNEDSDLTEAITRLVGDDHQAAQVNTPTVDTPPAVDDALCGLEWALRCICWLMIAGIMTMFLTNIALLN